MIPAIAIFTGFMLACYSPTMLRNLRRAVAGRPRRARAIAAPAADSGPRQPGRHRRDAILRPRGLTLATFTARLDADADAAQRRMAAAVAAEEGRLNVPAEMRPEGSRPLADISRHLDAIYADADVKLLR